MTVTSSGHRRFVGLDNDDEDLCLHGILCNPTAMIIYLKGYVHVVVVIVIFLISNDLSSVMLF